MASLVSHCRDLRLAVEDEAWEITLHSNVSFDNMVWWGLWGYGFNAFTPLLGGFRASTYCGILTKEGKK
jgi:steroid 5-alpha reductase family enzyme